MSQYYYSDGTNRLGPFSLDELKIKGIGKQTLVWREGFTDWMQAGNVSELAALFAEGSTTPPPVNPSPGAMPFEKPPKNWLIESILITIFCCLPLGIVGIIHATKVESLWNSGQRDLADKAAKDAAKWVKIGFISGIVVYVLYILMMVLGVVSSIGFDMMD